MSRAPILLGSKCKKCGIILTRDNCVTHRHNIKSSCKKCWAEYLQNWKSNNLEKHRAYDLKIHGISLIEYDKKVELQLGGCAICKQPCKTHTRLCVDHNHKTGQLRDLLCNRCNRVLGLAEENEELFFAMIEYLKRHEVKIA